MTTSSDKAADQEDIKFVKVLRDCPHNSNLKAGAKEESQGLISRFKGYIYDYDVLVNGVKQASFRRCTYGSGYDLMDMDDQFIRVPEWVGSKSTKTVHIKSKDQFRGQFVIYRGAGLIPTREQLDKQIAEKNEKARIAAEQRAEEERIERIEKSGPRLLAALKALLPLADTETPNCPECREARAAIAEAEGQQ